MRIGLLGCGGIGSMHADNLLSMKRPLAAVMDVDASRAKAMADAHQAKVVPDLPALIQESDALIIATPPFQHADQVVAAAASGRHIFCEKPLCLTLTEADRIGKALAASKGKFMIGYVLRFFPGYRRARQLLADGKLGGLVQCWIRRWHLWKNYFDNAWLGDPAKSGGMTVEFFTHDLDWLVWVGGMPKRVFGWNRKVNPTPESAIEDNIAVTLTFEQGVGMGSASWTSPHGSSSFGILGEKGSAIFSKGGPPSVKYLDGVEEKIELPDEDGYVLEKEEFFRCIEENRNPSLGFEAARRALAVALAAQQSARSGEAVDPTTLK